MYVKAHYRVYYNIYLGIIDDPSDSIFTYSRSGSWNTFYKPDYTPLFEAKFNDPELEEEALKVCYCNCDSAI